MSAPAFAIPRSVEASPVVLEPASEKEIAELAYWIWEERGYPHGSPREDWLESERWLFGTNSPNFVRDDAE